MVYSQFFTGIKGAKAGFGVALDEWLVGGNPSAASTNGNGLPTVKKKKINKEIL